MNRFSFSLSLLAALAVSLGWSSEAHAMGCSIAGSVGMAFGGYDPFASWPVDSAGSISFTCTGVGPHDTLVIQLGRGSSAGFFPRELRSTGASLGYNLFLDAARTMVWGDGSGGTSTYGPVTPPESSSTTVNIFGRIPASQNVPVGTYSDTVVVTLLY